MISFLIPSRRLQSTFSRIGYLQQPLIPPPAAASLLVKPLTPLVETGMNTFDYQPDSSFLLYTQDKRGAVAGHVEEICQIGIKCQSQVVRIILTSRSGTAPTQIPLNTTLVGKFFDPDRVLDDEDHGFNTTGEGKADLLFSTEFAVYRDRVSLLPEKLTPTFHGAFLLNMGKPIHVILMEYMNPDTWTILDDCPRDLGPALLDFIWKKMEVLHNKANFYIDDISTKNIFVKLKDRKVLGVIFIDFAQVVFEPGEQALPTPRHDYAINREGRREELITKLRDAKFRLPN